MLSPVAQKIVAALTQPEKPPIDIANMIGFGGNEPVEQSLDHLVDDGEITPALLRAVNLAQQHEPELLAAFLNSGNSPIEVFDTLFTETVEMSANAAKQLTRFLQQQQETHVRPLGIDLNYAWRNADSLSATASYRNVKAYRDDTDNIQFVGAENALVDQYTRLHAEDWHNTHPSCVVPGENIEPCVTFMGSVFRAMGWVSLSDPPHPTEFQGTQVFLSLIRGPERVGGRAGLSRNFTPLRWLEENTNDAHKIPHGDVIEFDTDGLPSNLDLKDYQLNDWTHMQPGDVIFHYDGSPSREFGLYPHVTMVHSWGSQSANWERWGNDGFIFGLDADGSYSHSVFGSFEDAVAAGVPDPVPFVRERGIWGEGFSTPRPFNSSAYDTTTSYEFWFSGGATE